VNRRLRVRFTKTGKVRFTSHRDVARIWERALRRAGLPVAYTEGFSPHPKLSFGLALSTGYESLAEYLDINLRDDAPGGDVPCEQLPALLDPALPVGIDVQKAVVLAPGAASLQQAVTSCTWYIELSGPRPVGGVAVVAGVADLAALVDRVLSQPEVVVTRERKGHPVTEDIRPGILTAQVLDPRSGGSSTAALETELATQPRSLRPAELVGALDPALVAGRVVRTHQWTLVGGARQEVIPLPPAATLAPHAEARAS
jgi:radical SAM-linked protein